MASREQQLSAEETAEFRAYLEQHQFAEYSIDELVNSWTAFWERIYGEKPDPKRTACARYFFELCRDTLQLLNRRYH